MRYSKSSSRGSKSWSRPTRAAKTAESKLAAKIEKLEAQLKSDSELGERVAELEKQRDDLGKRLTKVLSLIDGTLAKEG